MPLNDRQRLFVREYLKDFNGTQAAIRAGYAKDSAKVAASRLLTNANVQSELGLLAHKALSKDAVTVERVIKELASMAFLDPADFFDDDGELLPIKKMPEEARRTLSGLDFESITMNETKIGRVAKIRHTRKEKALEMLGKYLQMWQDAQVNVNVVRVVDLTGVKQEPKDE